jgi:hypothetical protein
MSNLNVISESHYNLCNITGLMKEGY